VVGVVEVVDNCPLMSVDDGEHSAMDQRSDVERQVAAAVGHGLGHGHHGHIAGYATGQRATERRTVDRWPGRYVRHAERRSGLQVDEWDDRTTRC